jgi:hypothetical protein
MIKNPEEKYNLLGLPLQDPLLSCELRRILKNASGKLYNYYNSYKYPVFLGKGPSSGSSSECHDRGILKIHPMMYFHHFSEKSPPCIFIVFLKNPI